MTRLQLPRTLHLAVSWTDRQGGTAEAVKHVYELQKYNTHARVAIQGLGDLATQFIINHQNSNLHVLADLINQAHIHLRHLQLSVPLIEEYIQAHRAAGAIAAKLTGAGLGGAMFALYADSNTRTQALEVLKSQSIQAWCVDVQC